MEVLIDTAITHDHPLPDIDAKPDHYSYADGCAVIKHPDGHSTFIPNEPDTD